MKLIYIADPMCSWCYGFGPELAKLLARADSALALAKERGRNRVVALSLGRSIAA